MMNSQMKREKLYMLQSWLRCTVRIYGTALSETANMYLFAAAIGCIIGFESSSFYFFLSLAVFCTVLRCFTLSKRGNDRFQ